MEASTPPIFFFFFLPWKLPNLPRKLPNLPRKLSHLLWNLPYLGMIAWETEKSCQHSSVINDLISTLHDFSILQQSYPRQPALKDLAREHPSRLAVIGDNVRGSAPCECFTSPQTRRTETLFLVSDSMLLTFRRPNNWPLILAVPRPCFTTCRTEASPGMG